MNLKFKKIIFFLSILILYTKTSLAEVTFQEILENPGDLEINLKYATEQETLGRYKATLSTLERLNMLYPVNTDLKLYLISILLKMDSVAKLQLMIETMLQDPNTTKETRDYIEEILETIRDQSRPKPKWFAYLDVNYMQTDHSNVDGVTKSGKLYAGSSIGNFRSDAIKYDKTYTRGGSITIGKNLNSTSAISFSGSLNINTQNKGRLYENDLTSGSVSYSKILGKHYLLPYIFYSRPNERSSADLNTKGIGFNNTYNINQNNSINYSSSISTTSYNKISKNELDNPDVDNNSFYSTNIGYNYIFSDINLISTKISYSKKKAKADYNAYSGHGLNIGYTRVLPFGNLKIDKTFEKNKYDEKDFIIHNTKDRKDDIKTSQIQLSGKLIQILPFFKKLDPKGQIFYNIKHTEIDSDSTLLNNSAIRESTSFNIIKRFTLYE